MKQAAHISSHPRRPPAHLSVSLKRVNPTSTSQDVSAQSENAHDKYKLSKSVKTRPSSHESNGSSAANVERWFDRSSKQLPNVDLPDYEDNDSPGFMPGTVSARSNEPESNQRVHPSYAQFQDRAFHTPTANSSADDYRSVIDDLTIENKRLKEKLRKYEKLHSRHLEKDKLFEVKIHALPAAKRRDLEDTLRNFASRIEGVQDEVPRSAPKLVNAQLPTPSSDPKNRSTGSSNSRPEDSGYASMPNSGPTSTTTHNTGGLEKKPKPVVPTSKEQNIQSFLHDIPEGLLPKHSVVMTKNQKKKLVVKRLEQLFTGKVKGIIASHNQTLQQQEVSNSAARADQARSSQPTEEGLREANILPPQMDEDDPEPAGLPQQYSQDVMSSASSASGVLVSVKPISSPGQRPTRPLDLDPDREQNPSDNVEYLRHLGVSTTQLLREDSSDAEPDAEGWIYLNLLINMAQLHIMNVTPDFVRSAVSDVSTKFQLSKDGKQIRWRGGKEGTRLSSDSDNSSPGVKRHQENESESEIDQKRRKVEGQLRHTGQFSSIPQIALDPMISVNTSASENAFHYKPLFHHRSSDDFMSHNDSTPDRGFSISNLSEMTGGSHDQRALHRRSGSSSSRRRTDDGPIAFYSGAKFCTDLSGDRTNIVTPLHITGVGKDGYSNHTEDALGCPPIRPVSTFIRTTSGSLMRSRPFKDYSIGDPHRKCAPELLVGEATKDGDEDIGLALEWSSKSSQVAPLLNFSASGLGGTQPADHFTVSVQTRRTKLGTVSQSKISRSLRKQPIPTATLDLFRDSNGNLADDITARLASMSTFSTQAYPSRSPGLPVRTQIIDTKFIRLEPSELPEPSAYYEPMSTSDSDSSSDSSSSSGLEKYRLPISFDHWPRTSLSQPDIHPHQPEWDEDTSESDMEEDNDSSIDMLAHLRAVNPAMVAAQELEFEMAIRQPGSSAATVGEPSESTSGDESSNEESNSDDK